MIKPVCSCINESHENITCPDYRFSWILQKPYPQYAQDLALKAKVPVELIIPMVNLYNRDFTDFYEDNSYKKILDLLKDVAPINLSEKKSKFTLIQ